MRSVMVGMGTGGEEASEGVMSNTLKSLINAQTVRGGPTSNDDDELAFRKGSFCEPLSEYLECCNQEINEYKVCANCD